jgi:hypothetical protein
MVMGSDSHSRGREIPPDSRGLVPAMTVKAGFIQGVGRKAARNSQ